LETEKAAYKTIVEILIFWEWALCNKVSIKAKHVSDRKRKIGKKRGGIGNWVE
jgi:hypothetical protein